MKQPVPCAARACRRYVPRPAVRRRLHVHASCGALRLHAAEAPAWEWEALLVGSRVAASAPWLCQVLATTPRVMRRAVADGSNRPGATRLPTHAQPRTRPPLPALLDPGPWPVAVVCAQTWEQMADLAEQFHNKDLDGDGVPDISGACVVAQGEPPGIWAYGVRDRRPC